MSRFSFSNDEQGPFLEMRIDDIDLRLDWNSTMLFTHKNNDYYDHVFVEIPELEDEEDSIRSVGAFIWRFIWRQVLPDWQDLANGLITHDFPHLHSPWPNEHDVESYRKSGLVVPKMKELVVIEEVEDDDEVMKAMYNFDAEWRYYSEE